MAVANRDGRPMLGWGSFMTEVIMEYLNRNIATVPILLFFLGMLAGVVMTWLVMRR